MTFNQLLTFNPQTLIDNPHLITPMNATVSGRLEIQNHFAFVRVEVVISGNVWVIEKLDLDHAIAFLEKLAITHKDLSVVESFAQFTISPAF